MSMSTHISGVVPADDEYKKMIHVYDACVEAGIDVPQEVWDFFGGDVPDPNGTVIDIKEACVPFKAEGCSGFEIDIVAIPEHIKTLRFYNSW